MPSSARPAGVPTGLRLAALVMTAGAFGGAPAVAAPPLPPHPVASPSPAPGALLFSPSTGSFETSLRRRLEDEARRQKLGFDMPFFVAPGDDPDPLEPERGRRVERTILRALRGAIDERLEDAARGSTSLAPLFQWIDGRDDGRPGRAGGVQAAPRPESAALSRADAPSSAAPQGVGDLTLRFRLDAHPRLLLGARLGAVSGRIEVPVLDREVRLSLERPLGEHGRASIRGGRSAEDGDWADLSLHFSF